MYRKRCYRTLDRPLEFFGLEVEDWGFLIVGAGAIGVLLSPVLGCALAIGGWLLLRRLKSGRPAGYVFYLVYRSGLVRYLPGILRSRGLLRPPSAFARDRRVRLSAFKSDEDDDRADVRFFRDA